jgi:hypothetical protein
MPFLIPQDVLTKLNQKLVVDIEAVRMASRDALRSINTNERLQKEAKKKTKSNSQ